jgi:hypothetical protein
MRLRNSGIQTITVGEKILRAYRLDMSLSDPLARMFRPHLYRYWFSAEDFHFLAYKGRMGDKPSAEVRRWTAMQGFGDRRTTKEMTCWQLYS